MKYFVFLLCLCCTLVQAQVLTYNDSVLLACVNSATRTSPISGYPQPDSILLFIDSTDDSLVTSDRLLNAGSLGTNADMYITTSFVTNYTLGGTNYYSKVMIGTNQDWFDGLNPPVDYYGFWTHPLSVTNWLLKGTIAFKCATPPDNSTTYLFTPTTTLYESGNNGGILLGNNLWSQTGGGQRFPVYMSITNGYDNQYYEGGIYGGEFSWPGDGALHWLIITWDNTAAISNTAGAYPTYTMAVDMNQLAGSTFDDPSWPNSLAGPLNTSLPVRIGIPGPSASQKLIMWNRPLTLLERIQILSH